MPRGRRAVPDPPARRVALVPAALAVVVAVRYGLGASLWAAVAASGPVLALALVAPFWAARSVAGFDRDVVLALARGRAGSLRDRYRRALGMRLFAPVPVRAERRGLAAAESGDAEAALSAYREAIEGWEAAGATPPVAVLFGTARAAEELGRFDEAEKALRALERLDATVPGLADRLARAAARRSATERA